jgi:hypothetical protein
MLLLPFEIIGIKPPDRGSRVLSKPLRIEFFRNL